MSVVRPESGAPSSGGANEAVRERLALVRAIAPRYAALPGAAGLLVGGSVARGVADRWSDVELGVFWVSVPTGQTREATALALGGRHFRLFSDPGATGALEEDFELEGIKVDISHMTVAQADGLIDDVIDGFDADLGKQSLMSVFRYGLPLFGEDLLSGWRRRVERYPDGLARSTVARHLIFGPHWYLDMLAERDDALILADLLSRIGRAVLGVLCGLNRIFPPSPAFKWLWPTLADLAVAPDGMERRLRRMLQGDAGEGVRVAKELIDETIVLVERHLPEVDTSPVRARVAQRRTASFSD